MPRKASTAGPLLGMRAAVPMPTMRGRRFYPSFSTGDEETTRAHRGKDALLGRWRVQTHIRMCF